MTSHLHTPTLRLVSLNPFLWTLLTFLRVPEIHDGYEYKLFFSRTTTTNDAIDLILDELGLTKSLPIPGGGNLEYVLEEVWVDGHLESTTPQFGSGLILADLLTRILEASWLVDPSQRREVPILAQPSDFCCETPIQVLRA